MKKNTCVPLILVFSMILMFPTHLFAKTNPDLFINGNSKNVQTILKDSSTLVPLRFCSEELQAIVNWNESTQEIIVSKGSNTILFKVGQKTYYVNGEKKSLLAAPEIINGVTYMPFRPIVEVLDGIVLYNNEHKVVNIYDTSSTAYNIYKSLSQSDITKKRFAILESPRISLNPPSSSVASHTYIFPLETPNANYFFEYWGDWTNDSIVALNYYEVIDGIAINTWGRQTNQVTSLADDSHPLFKLVGNDSFKNKKEFGTWPSPKDLNFIMFEQKINSTIPTCHYINNIWTDFFKLDSSEVGTLATNSFHTKDIYLFDVDNKMLLNKYNK